MQNRVSNNLENFNLLYSRQFGFRSTYSTVDALVELTERIRFENNSQINCSFFIDLKKAFHTLDHRLLLKKLELYGIRGIALNWFESYLAERFQCVVIDDTFSKWLPVTCGVPQGSVLGPLPFLIYINDMPFVTEVADVFLFADNTNVVSGQSDLLTYQNDISNISSWLKSNKLTLNTDNTTMITFNKNTSDSSLMLTIDNHTYVPNHSSKYLGVHIDSKLSFQDHILKIRSKLGRNCGVLSKMRNFTPRSVLLKYYNYNILPIIQYGLLFYGCTSINALNPIHMLQKKIMRLIFYIKI